LTIKTDITDDAARFSTRLMPTVPESSENVLFWYSFVLIQFINKMLYLLQAFNCH